MGAGLFKAPTSNFWSSSLNGAINDSVQTITLNSTTGLQYPGYVVIDRENGSGTATPNAREVVKYTGISGSDLTGCTRGADNSTGRSHSDGAVVEAAFTIGMHNDQRDAIAAEHTTAGVHSILSAPTITQGWVNSAMLANATITTSNLISTVASTATVTNLVTPNAILGTTTVSTLTMVGGASVAPTVEGQLNWRTGDDTFMVGSGAAALSMNMGAWTSWVPNWTNFTKGSATIGAKYQVLGKIVNCELYCILAADSSVSGAITFSLPVTAADSVQYSFPVHIADAGTGDFVGTAMKGSATTMVIYVVKSDGTYPTIDVTSSTAPMTWTTNDYFACKFSYQAA